MTQRGTTLAASAFVVWRWTSDTCNPAKAARVALRCALEQLGYDCSVVTTAVQAVSEFVANADEHAVGPYELRLRSTSSEIICEVEDGDPSIPQVPLLPPERLFQPVSEDRGGGLEALCAVLSERGRGLQIVEELTKGMWGFRSCKGRKTAWLALTATPDEEHRPR